MAGSPIKKERNRLVREAILKGCASGQDPVDFIAPFIAKLKELALAGDLGALRELFDRLEGKAAQQVQLQGDEDQPLVARIVREVVAVPRQ